MTITQSFLTAASLAQVNNAPNGADSNLFCCDTRGLNSRSVKSVFFFCFCFSSSFKNLPRVFVHAWYKLQYNRNIIIMIIFYKLSSL